MNWDVTGTVKYNFKRLNWADHRVQMDGNEHQKKLLNGKFYGRAMVQLVWKYQEGLPIAAEYNRLEEISRGQEHLQAHYERGQGPMWAVMLLKMRKLFFMSHKLCIPTDPII